MNKRHLAVAASLLAVGITGAYSAGMFTTLPIVGGQAYCASVVTGIASPGNAPYLQPPGSTQGTGSYICGQTVPAGPVGLTGNEIFPADTYPTSATYGAPTPYGVPPSTVAVPIILTDSGAYQYSVPNATRANFTLVNPLNALILDGTGTLTQINVQLPGTVNQAALNGQQVHLESSVSITTLGVVGASGTTVANAPTVLTVTTSGPYGYSFIYDAPISTWFRVQ